MDLRDFLSFRGSRGAWQGLLGMLLLLLGMSPSPLLSETHSAEPRQIFRPLPLDPVSVVWRAEARQEGMSFRLYREESSGKLALLKQLPVELGRHDYRLHDLPQAERQRYVLRLVDAEGHESPLRTIELVLYTALDPQAPLPPDGHNHGISWLAAFAELPPRDSNGTRVFGPSASPLARAFEPPDPPPDLAPCFVG